MTIIGTYTAKDLVSPAWVHMRPRRSLMMLGCLVALLALFALWLSFSGPSAETQGWEKWLLPGAILYLALSFGLWMPHRLRRAYRQRKDLHRRCSFAISHTGLHFETDGIAGTKPWSDYLKWKVGETVILLYMSDNMYQAIPKHFFASESEFEEFIQMLTQMVPCREA